MEQNVTFQEQKARQPVRHGVLVLHGAGMPPDQKTLVGDPLSTIANGLIDAFNEDPLLREHYRLAARGKTKDHDLEELNLDIFRKSADGKSEALAHTLRMREVLWKPTMRKRSLLDYIPLLWLWAFAFQSHAVRKAQVERQSHGARADSATQVRAATIEEESQAARRLGDFLARVALAAAGVMSTLLWAFIAGEIAKALNPAWTDSSPEFILLWQITTSLISVSIVCALLLVFLAVEEWLDRSGRQLIRKGRRPHGRFHLLAVMLATAWLAIFLLPVLLLVYYFDRAVVLVAIVGLAAAAVFVTLWVDTWWLRIAFLLGMALVLWLVSAAKRARVGQSSKRFRGNFQSFVTRMITTLLVASAAPLLIFLIYALNLLSILPLGGDTFKKLAQSISEAGYWNAIQDLHMFLTDSSRSAVVRYCVEEGIEELGRDADHLHILSHSLGTVVAYDTLVQIGRGDGARIKKPQADPQSVYPKIKTLVTYGSPLNKIRVLANKAGEFAEVMSGLDCTRFGDDARLPADLPGFCWANFYALQDLVSDALTLYARPEDPVHPYEYSVESADDILTAHGAYWTDKGFWRTLLQTMGIAYESAEMSRIEQLQIAPETLRHLRAQGIFTQGQFSAQVSDAHAHQKMLEKARGKISAAQLDNLAAQLAPSRAEK